MKLVTAAAILAVAVLAGAAQAVVGPTPRQAARATMTCLAKNGWSVRLVDGGTTVVARGPRRSNSSRRAWYSVAFRWGLRPDSGTSSAELAISLNRRERRAARHCRSAGWR
jgi:hypothetical protein